MDDNKETKDVEGLDSSQKIEVKVASTSEETPSIVESGAVAETQSEPSSPELGNASTAVNELDPPPGPESNPDTMDEGALESQVPPTVESESHEDPEQQLTPVVSPPDDFAPIESEPVESAQITSSDVASSNPGVVVGAQPSVDHPHRNNKKLAIIITLFVGVLLAAVAVYVYMSANDNTKEVSPTQTPSSAESTPQTRQPKVEPATNEDIDEVAREVDEAINSLNDNDDFPEEQLSDESLGL